MSILNDVLTAVIGLAQSAAGVYGTITTGALPPDNGITITHAAGGEDRTFLTKGKVYSLSIVCNGKHTNQQTVSAALNNIHRALAQTKSYPKTTAYQILDISTTATPHYLAREDNSQWLYGSSLKVRVYIP